MAMCKVSKRLPSLWGDSGFHMEAMESLGLVDLGERENTIVAIGR